MKRKKKNEVNIWKMLPFIFLIIWIAFWVGVLVRNEQVYQYRISLIGTPEYRNLPGYYDMFWQFWRPVDSFLPSDIEFETNWFFIGNDTFDVNVTFIRGISFSREPIGYPPTHEVNWTREGNITTITIEHPCIKLIEAWGNSMRPFRKYRDLSIIDTCFDKSTLDVGDVIVYRMPWGMVQHRIIEINHEEQWVITQGDGNDHIDSRVDFSQIWGHTIGVLNIFEDGGL